MLRFAWLAMIPETKQYTHNNLKYIDYIDGLRFVAVSIVVLYHAGLSIFPGGFVGVDVFFVISGYLMIGILTR
jgi:peptidoglycan/LPS O-acetylase OafA/YrhL